MNNKRKRKKIKKKKRKKERKKNNQHRGSICYVPGPMFCAQPVNSQM
jgi:hypothetical protein